MGRRETPGRPVTWVTTEAFLTHFGLADRRDLPGIEELKAAGLIGQRPDLTLAETVMANEAPSEADEEEDEHDDDTVDAPSATEDEVTES